MKIYISLPIQGKDLNRQKAYAKDIAKRITDLGFQPINPFDNSLPDDADRAAHMKEDIRLLLDCRAIMMCKDWETSKGCLLEKSIAEQCALMILYDKD